MGTKAVRSKSNISKLVCNFAISNLHNAISKLSKFTNCVEHIYVMHKVRIGTILELSCAKFGSELCAGNPRIVQSSPTYYQCCAHACSIFCMCMLVCVCWSRMAHCETFEKWKRETFLSRKKSQKQGIIITKQGDDRLSFKMTLLHFS